ncbi:MAG: dioxygenase [Deltaproteobacteria bacterium]|nr:dioxygenase [Deltaproteobacteria bacterium]
MRQPTLYLPHGGGPCFFMDWTMGPPDTWDATAAWLRSIPASLPEPPKALLVISAHWEEASPTLLSGDNPDLLFDYSGFPPHTYKLTWGAPGAPHLASRVAELLGAAGIAHGTNPTRGYDHGVFVPLKVAWPEPTIPTLQLSLVRGLDPSGHIALGRALAPLRDDGVLIVGSGMSFHNMRLFGHPVALSVSEEFDRWMRSVCAEPAAVREDHLLAWEAAPEGRTSHPREEHLLPLHVCAGAAGDDPGKVVFSDVVMGSRVSAVRFG